MSDNDITNYILNYQFDLKLTSLEYKYVSLDNPTGDNVEIEENTDDTYEIEVIDLNFVNIKFQREKKFNPEIFFIFKINMEISYEIDDNDNINYTIIEKEAKDRIEELLAPILAQCSLILSNLTNIDMKYPIIDPPLLSIRNK